MFKQISKVISVSVLGFCLFGSIVANSSGLSDSVCPPAGCPRIGDPTEVKTSTPQLTAETCPESGCASYGCTQQKDGTCTMSIFEESPDFAKSDFMLSSVRYLTFIIVAISVVLFPISIICSIVFFFIKSKHLKNSLILILVSVLAFVLAILGYTLFGFVVSRSQL